MFALGVSSGPRLAIVLLNVVALGTFVVVVIYLGAYPCGMKC